MKEKYGGIDVLVNNAAIAFKNSATEPMGVQARYKRPPACYRVCRNKNISGMFTQPPSYHIQNKFKSLSH